MPVRIVLKKKVLWAMDDERNSSSKQEKERKQERDYVLEPSGFSQDPCLSVVEQAATR